MTCRVRLYQIKAIRVTICRDARSCVRCVKGYSVGLLSVSVGSTTDARPCVPTNRYTSGCYSIVVLTGTDALRLDTSVRPYKSLLVGLLPVGSLHNTK